MLLQYAVLTWSCRKLPFGPLATANVRFAPISSGSVTKPNGGPQFSGTTRITIRFISGPCPSSRGPRL